MMTGSTIHTYIRLLTTSPKGLFSANYTIPKEFEIISLVFSVAVTVSAFGNMALSILRNRSKNNYFPMNIINYQQCLICSCNFATTDFFLFGEGERVK